MLVNSQNVSKFQKNSEHETKDYHIRTLEKSKKFAMTFVDPIMTNATMISARSACTS